MYGALPLLGFSTHPNLEIVKGDVRDAPAIAKVVKDHDWILHLAAIVGYPACAADPHLAMTHQSSTARAMSSRRWARASG